MKRRAAIAALVIVAAALCLLPSRYAMIRYDDEPFQALNCQLYQRSPLGMLSFYTGYIWTTVFGNTLLALRVLRAICYLTAAGIGAMFVWRESRDSMYAAAVFYIGALALSLSTLPLYGWDAAPYPATFATLWAIYRYLREPGVKAAALMGALAGICVMSRITLAPCAIVILASIWHKRRNSIPSILRESAVCAGVMLGIMVVIMTIMVGSPTAYFRAFAPENIINGHSVGDIVNAFHRFNLLVEYSYVTYIPGVCAVICAAYARRLARINIFFMLAACALIVLLTRETLYISSLRMPLYWMVNGLVIPMALLLLFFGPLDNIGIRRPARDGAWRVLVLVSFFLLPAIGSDAIPERLGWCTAIIFGSGIYHGALSRHSRFTKWLFFFTALSLTTAACLKIRWSHNAFPQSVHCRHTTVFDGLYTIPDMRIAAVSDTLVGIKNDSERLGLNARYLSRDARVWYYVLDIRDAGDAMKFWTSEDDIIREFDYQDHMRRVDLIMTSESPADSRAYAYFIEQGFKPTRTINDGKITIMRRERRAGSLTRPE